MSTVRLRGFDEIDRNLQRMERSVRGQVLDRALVRSARDMEATYRRNAPDFIRKGVAIRQIQKDVSPNRSQVSVGSRHPLAHIFEFGTKLRRTAQGFRRGRIQHLGFGRRAFDTSVRRWFDHLGRALWSEIRRAVR